MNTGIFYLFMTARRRAVSETKPLEVPFWVPVLLDTGEKHGPPVFDGIPWKIHGIPSFHGIPSNPVPFVPSCPVVTSTPLASMEGYVVLSRPVPS